ncbi:hypothetical protein CBM2592_A80018 [Cupriavidus taiwanensis]|nr:hypothetical protein CBM2588_A50014 [Cupriavidus taiwanensis]SOY55662.1 hypothetical protein CBM2592_A80018 [Cupriavidus taiwanensis]SOZ61761.1 hypothetical protein CBM2617_A40369 [Cupriavidus taiwanensis]SOZ81830.1 hypothetical protein CBM2618_A50372 [Cupriavidus taiwanensis]SOZ83057.1 hypothetical protein CBM2622_A50373 [Cupriavidus taiwanensis]
MTVAQRTGAAAHPLQVSRHGAALRSVWNLPPPKTARRPPPPRVLPCRTEHLTPDA